MQTQYGVTTAQSSRSGLARYDAGAGIEKVCRRTACCMRRGAFNVLNKRKPATKGGFDNVSRTD